MTASGCSPKPGVVPEPVGVYFYDGGHTWLAHYLALGVAEPLLADEALVLVDDASWPLVARGDSVLHPASSGVDGAARHPGRGRPRPSVGQRSAGAEVAAPGAPRSAPVGLGRAGPAPGSAPAWSARWSHSPGAAFTGSAGSCRWPAGSSRPGRGPSRPARPGALARQLAARQDRARSAELPPDRSGHDGRRRVAAQATRTAVTLSWATVAISTVWARMPNQSTRQIVPSFSATAASTISWTSAHRVPSTAKAHATSTAPAVALAGQAADQRPGKGRRRDHQKHARGRRPRPPTGRPHGSVAPTDDIRGKNSIATNWVPHSPALANSAAST